MLCNFSKKQPTVIGRDRFKAKIARLTENQLECVILTAGTPAESNTAMMATEFMDSHCYSSVAILRPPEDEDSRPG